MSHLLIFAVVLESKSFGIGKELFPKLATQPLPPPLPVQPLQLLLPPDHPQQGMSLLALQASVTNEPI